MSALGMIKTFIAATQIEKRRIVAFGVTEGAVLQATAGANLLGVSGVRGAQSGAPIDVYLSDVHDLECGGALAAGDYVTADNLGRAIKAAPTAGVTMQVIGRALEGCEAAGAICNILIMPQQITG